ncbi:MAG: response regulator [Bryobacteraceae bacterium]|nr:response regulator [Bryobacteraceae bacterium]
MPGESKAILIIEDSLEDRAYLKRLLETMPQTKWRFVEAATAAQGLAHLAQQPFDCVLLDHCLPDASGLDFMEDLRVAPVEPNTAVVFVTGAGDERLAADAIRAGATDYVSKQGLTAQKLFLAVQRAMEQQTLDLRRRQMEKEVGRSRQRLRTMAETIPGILFTHRPDGYVDYLSHRFYDFTGLPEGAGEGHGWVIAMHPDEAEREVRRRQARIEGGEPYEFEHRLRGGDGEYRWFKTRVVPVLEHGLISEWSGVSIDIQDLQETRSELERRKQELERSNEELQRFADVVAHDLQSPLRTVETMTQLLAQRYSEAQDDETREMIGFVVSGVSRMRRLIADLIDYSSLSGRPSIAPQDSSDSVKWAISNLQGDIAVSGAVVRVDHPLPWVMADHQLGRVLQNLMANAIKYRGEAGPEIRLQVERKLGMWQFAVRDNGIGFEMQFADKVFGVFERLESAERYEGSGLGLAICKRVIEQNGGRVWAESVPGEGSTFYFTVPGVDFALHAAV